MKYSVGDCLGCKPYRWHFRLRFDSPRLLRPFPLAFISWAIPHGPTGNVPGYSQQDVMELNSLIPHYRSGDRGDGVFSQLMQATSQQALAVAREHVDSSSTGAGQR